MKLELKKIALVLGAAAFVFAGAAFGQPVATPKEAAANGEFPFDGIELKNSTKAEVTVEAEDAKGNKVNIEANKEAKKFPRGLKDLNIRGKARGKAIGKLIRGIHAQCADQKDKRACRQKIISDLQTKLDELKDLKIKAAESGNKLVLTVEEGAKSDDSAKAKN